MPLYDTEQLSIFIRTGFSCRNRLTYKTTNKQYLRCAFDQTSGFLINYGAVPAGKCSGCRTVSLCNQTSIAWPTQTVGLWTQLPMSVILSRCQWHPLSGQNYTELQGIYNASLIPSLHINQFWQDAGVGTGEKRSHQDILWGCQKQASGGETIYDYAPVCNNSGSANKAVVNPKQSCH